MTIGEWVHIAGSYDGTTMRFYIDGELKGTKVAAYSTNQLKNMRIGAGRNDSPDADYHFNGKVDELSIWSRVITEAEINQMKDNGRLEMTLTIAGLILFVC
ncbi:MAG: LamG domain-containing protein [Bacteroidota bacterium]